MKPVRAKPVSLKGPPLPQVHERWVDRRVKRPAVVVAVVGMCDAITVSYRYIQGVNGSGLWKRGVTPTQTISLDDWRRRFVLEETR